MEGAGVIARHIHGALVEIGGQIAVRGTHYQQFLAEVLTVHAAVGTHGLDIAGCHIRGLQNLIRAAREALAHHGLELLDRFADAESTHIVLGIAAHDRHLQTIVVDQALVGIVRNKVTVDGHAPAILLGKFDAGLTDGFGRKCEILEEGNAALFGIRECGITADRAADAAAGLVDRAMEQTLFVQRGGQLEQNAASACRLSKDGDAVRIAAEVCDIALDPLEGHLLVIEAEVGRADAAGFGGQLRMRKEAQRADAVRDRNEHVPRRIWRASRR